MNCTLNQQNAEQVKKAIYFREIRNRRRREGGKREEVQEEREGGRGRRVDGLKMEIRREKEEKRRVKRRKDGDLELMGRMDQKGGPGRMDQEE